jgi:xanthine/uracil permease
MGFDPNVAVFFSGIGTLIFFVAVGGRVSSIGLIAVATTGLWRRLPIILGAIAGYLVYLVLANGLGWGKPIDFGSLAAAPWVGLPKFTTPTFHGEAMSLIAPWRSSWWLRISDTSKRLAP